MSTRTTRKNSNNPALLVGCKIRKYFDGHGWFVGNITSYDNDQKLFHVYYPEDEDQEEMTEQEVKKLLLIKTEENEDEFSIRKRQKDVIDDDHVLEEDIDTNPPKKMTTPNTGITAHSVTPSPPPASTASSVASSAKRRATPSKRRSGATPTKKWNPKSIAARGLPRGALARCPHTGCTVRTLEGILPLKSKESSLSREDLESKLLPGSFVVVAAPSNRMVTEVEDDVVGKTFASASDISSVFRATYLMEAVADPAFSSFPFVEARLEAAGLLEKEKDAIAPMVVQIHYNGDVSLDARIVWYDDYVKSNPDKEGFLWGIIENEGKTLVVGVPPSLATDDSTVECNVTADDVTDNMAIEACISNDANDESGAVSSPDDVLPRLTPQQLHTSLPASLLEKAIRRGCGLCSMVPLLEACTSLLLPSVNGSCMPGATLAFLGTAWKTTLVDASPFAGDGTTCLGTDDLALLSLVAKVSPTWTMPLPLCRAAVAGVVRVANSSKSQMWIGHVKNNKDWFVLEPESTEKSRQFRNILRVAQIGVGGRLAWGKWNKFVGDGEAAAVMSYLNAQDWHGSRLEPAPDPIPQETSILSRWLKGGPSVQLTEPRFIRLDEECHLASISPNIFPHSLVVLQALLKSPPRAWKKHALPNLAKQVRKLMSDVNPRVQERIQLQRLATWGKVTQTASTQNKQEKTHTKVFVSYREVATPTGSLSDQETELVECYEAVQKRQIECLRETNRHFPTNTSASIRARPINAGMPLNEFDGRIAFLLAFGFAIEVDILMSSGLKEKVSAMFCGNPGQPLLVQRIGKARNEGKDLATSGGSMSGALAVPSLGYVQKERSEEETKIFAAAEKAVAAYWKDGFTSPLPLPPPGFQWDVGMGGDGWENTKQMATRNAVLLEDGWHFSVDGVDVVPFDARNIVTPCALEIDDKFHLPLPLEENDCRCKLLSVALYHNQEEYGSDVLGMLFEMHALAESDRNDTPDGPSEGTVYDWIPLALACPLPSRTWRDLLLAIRTRDANHVVLGRGIQPNGNGAPRDMTEGVLFRLFHALEMLYPTVLRKKGAMVFRVRPKGAAYYHLLSCLEQLSNPTGPATEKLEGRKRARELKESSRDTPPTKRPRRTCQTKSSPSTSNDAEVEEETTESEIDVSVKYQDGACLPEILTPLWPHQATSVEKIVEGVRQGKRGHADASAVGAGKSLTALATIVALQEHLKQSGCPRQGVLVMLPGKSLIREWLLEIASHTRGFHVIEQREDGSLFSLTYGKSHPPIDANALVVSTLDRVARHPFVRDGVCWDFVVIDECLAVQNATAKRNPSAWRQIETARCGCLMLSATFFRSSFDQLFYMIRMLRSPLPRTMEFLPATIHEHIVCQVPESDRSWKMEPEMVSLKPNDLSTYRKIIDGYERKRLNEGGGDGRILFSLWPTLEKFLREKYEGRSDNQKTYNQSDSVMASAFARVVQRLVKKKRRPLVFADTAHEADFLLRVLRSKGIDACTWSEISSKATTTPNSAVTYDAIVANKKIEGSGLNLQRHADAIICRPTPGDHLEQMKGRIDRPGQTRRELLLVVVVAEHTIEECKFANIHLAGNFFREYIAPVATRYKERKDKVDLSATLSVGGTKKLSRGTVTKVWRQALADAGQSGAFANVEGSLDETSFDPGEDLPLKSSKKNSIKDEPKYKPLNKVLRNKGDPVAVKEAKERAMNGHTSPIIRNWLFPSKATSNRPKGKPKLSFERFNDTTPPLVLDRPTIEKAAAHLSLHDEKLASLIARVGVDALVIDCGTPCTPTQAGFFDTILRSIAFTMVSVDAGNAFMRRLAMKVGVCLEGMPHKKQKQALEDFAMAQEGNITPEEAMNCLIEGRHNEIRFSHEVMKELVEECEVIEGKRTGYPHICGVTHPCGKHDDPKIFLSKARDQSATNGAPVSAGFSRPKAEQIIDLVKDFVSGKVSAQRIAAASDRQAAKMLMELNGIGDWGAGEVLMHNLKRADIMLYGDLTVRNYLNDLYDINHQEDSETWLESAADFPDTGPNRNLMDSLSEKNNWGPYRSLVCYLMYHMAEENLVLL